MAAENEALLEIAGVLEAMRSAIVNGDGVAYNPMEVFLAAMQATLQMLAGGTPSKIVLPNILNPAGLSDTAVARFCNGVIIGAPYSPSGTPAGTATQNNIPADGSAAASITFATPFASVLTALFTSAPYNYNGGDNASLSVVENSRSLDGFEVTVSGGAPSSTCSLDYLPYGV